MKLKSCFLITLMVCAFFSCSDNDDPVNLTITPVVPDATLSLAVRTNDRVKTKGGFIEDDENFKPGDITWDFQVKTLTAVIFNNGAYDEGNIPKGGIAAIFTQNYATPTATPIIEGEVKSGDIQLLLIANLHADVLSKLTSSVNSTTNRLDVAGVLKLTTDLAEEGKNKGLTMSSEVKSLTIEPGINFIGFGNRGELTVEGIGTGTEIYGPKPIDLVRTVAAINLVGVLLPETPDPENSKYKNVSFTLDSVFVANVKSTAGIGTNADVNSIEQSPLNSDDGTLNQSYYLAPLNYVDSIGQFKTGKAKGDNSMLRVLSEAEKIIVTAGTDENTTEPLDWKNTEIPPCYVYPNQLGETGEVGKKNYTLLVLRGTYQYSIAGSGPVTEPNRYYTVIVNDNSLGGEIEGDTGKTNVRIQRNTKYNVTVQILGSGSDKAFDPAAFAHVAAKVKVADWNVIEVNQDVD